ncbi:MAG: hypothetical protein GVY12_04700 [Bacteroidetes bacterium]|jgi:hypothetical protein|nr:hypothetical protein [Bacteroidota bacterium]
MIASAAAARRGLAWVVLLFLLNLPALAAESAGTQAPDDPTVQVLSHDDLVERGVYHLSDLFWLVDDWAVQSVDGYGWSASAAGLAPLQRAAWLLVVDEQPVDLQALRRQHIDQLPLRVDDLATVEVHTGPTWIAGRPALQGALHLKTRAPAAGLSAYGQVTTASEISDPGPFEFTGEDDTNVDRMGPLLGATGTAAYGPATLRLGAKADERHADNFIRPRVRTLCRGACIFRGAPVMRQTSLHAETRLTAGPTAHRLRAYDSQMDEQLFFESAGLEVPSATRFRTLQGAGTVTVSSRAHVRYEADLTDHRLARVADLPGLDVHKQSWGGRLSLTHLPVGAIHADVRWRDTTAPSLQRQRHRTSRLHYYTTARVSADWSQHLGLSLSETNGTVGVTAFTSTRLRLGGRRQTLITASLDHRPPSATPDLPALLREGLAVDGPTDRFDPGSVMVNPAPDRTTRVVADLHHTIRVSSRLRLGGTVGWRLFDGVPLVRTAAEPQPANPGLRTALTVTEGRGQVLRSGLRAEGVGAQRVQPRLFARYQRVLSADEAFGDAWASQPAWQLGAALRVMPVARLTLFGRVLYESAMGWPGYAEAAASAPERFVDTLPRRWRVHLTAQKQFFRDHFRLSVSLRDLAQKPIRYHPAGAPIDMSFFVNIQAQW